MSKHFLGNAIGRLIASGDIHLYERIDSYFPDIEILKNDITVYNLLHNTSGLPNL